MYACLGASPGPWDDGLHGLARERPGLSERWCRANLSPVYRDRHRPVPMSTTPTMDSIYPHARPSRPLRHHTCSVASSRCLAASSFSPIAYRGRPSSSFLPALRLPSTLHHYTVPVATTTPVTPTPGLLPRRSRQPIRDKKRLQSFSIPAFQSTRTRAPHRRSLSIHITQTAIVCH